MHRKIKNTNFYFIKLAWRVKKFKFLGNRKNMEVIKIYVKLFWIELMPEYITILLYN